VLIADRWLLWVGVGIALLILGILLFTPDMLG
jgi:hypothetical protein